MPGTTSHGDARFRERVDLFLRAAEQHRVAALEPHHDAMHARGIDEALVDEALRGRMLAAALADRDLLARARRARSSPDARARRGTRCRLRRAGAPRAASAGPARPGRRRRDRRCRWARGREASARHRIIPAATVRVGGLVDQDEAARGGVVVVAVADDGLRQRQRRPAPMSFIASAAGAGSCDCVDTFQRCSMLRRRGRAPRAWCGAGSSAAAIERALVEPAERGLDAAHGLGRRGARDDHVAARDVDLVGEHERDRVVQRGAAAACRRTCGSRAPSSCVPKAAP